MTARPNPACCQEPTRFMSTPELHKELEIRHHSCTVLDCGMKLYCREELKRRGHTPGPARHCMRCRHNEGQ